MNPQIQQLIEQAIGHFQSGKLEQAEQLLVKVLSLESDNIVGLEILGLIKASQNKPKESVYFLKKAIALNPENPSTQYNLAKALSESGDFIESVRYHEQALKLAPNNPDGWLNYGQTLSTLKQYEAALRAFDHALSIHKNYAEAWHNKAIVSTELMRYEEALNYYAEALRLKPDVARMWKDASACFGALKRYQEAMGCCDRALLLQPNYPEALLNKGSALNELKEFEGAIDCYSQAIAFNGDYAEAWHNKGVALCGLKRHEEALAAFDRAIEINPSYVEAYNNKGIALQELKRHEEALAGFDRAIEINPIYVEAYNNKGITLHELKRYEDALTAFKRAIDINPGYVEALSNQGATLQACGLLAEAIESYKKAISIKPEYSEAHHNLALLWLYMLNFKDGWSEFEWRWQGRGLAIPMSGSKKPNWNGSRTENRLLVLGEQGVGDQVLYSSVFKELAQFGKTVTVALAKKLIPIYSRTYPELAFIDLGQEISDDQFDEIVTIASLMKYFRPDVASFQRATFPYLKADQLKVEKFKRIQNDFEKISCGIAWSSASPTLAGNKSIPIAELAPIIEQDKYEFFNLQFGDISPDLERLKKSCKKEIHKFDEVDFFDDLDSVAAIIQACGLVVTSSNSVAHISGALNKPTILILPFSIGKLWYWHEVNGYSLWYPSIKIFSQTEHGGWGEVIGRVKAYMEKLDFGR